MPSMIAPKWTLSVALMLAGGCGSDDAPSANGELGDAASTGADARANAAVDARVPSHEGAEGGSGSEPDGALDPGTNHADGGPPLSFQCDDAAPKVEAPSATWVNATGNLAGMGSECGNLGLV